MGLQTSGAISLNEIHVEAGGSSGTQASINDTDIRALISKASGAQMSFSEWYGASASFTIATGNSFYQAGSQYVIEQHHLIVSGANFQTGYASTTDFTMNSRTTRFWGLSFSSINSRYIFSLIDITGGGGAITAANNGHPANSGWTSCTITGNGSSRTFTRTSATYNASGRLGINNQYYSAGQWTMPTGISNIFPNSNNTTSFTMVLTP